MNSRVWNRGRNEYSEKYKNKIITIPSGKFVLMNTYDASAFKGQYPGKGIEKILEIEDIPDKVPEKALLVCNFCADTFATPEELNAHIGIHKPALIEDDEKELEAEAVASTARVHKGWPKGVPRKRGAEALNETNSNNTNG